MRAGAVPFVINDLESSHSNQKTMDVDKHIETDVQLVKDELPESDVQLVKDELPEFMLCKNDETLFKEEPLDQDFRETCQNVCDSHFEVFKHELCDGSEMEHLSDNHVHTATINNFSFNNLSAHSKPEPSQAGASSPAGNAETLDKPYHCKHCNYKCSQASHLKVHMRTHTGEKPYHCKHCNYKCSQASTLKVHMKFHTGEKPYSCSHCNYKSSLASTLKVHMRTHTGEKPYHCKHCNYKCSQASHLKDHMRTHTGEKPYHCKHCNYKCSQASHLKGHMRSQGCKRIEVEEW